MCTSTRVAFVANNKAGEEEKPLTYLKIKQTNKQKNLFRIKYLMLAIKIIVIKITKKGILSRHIKVMHSLQSKNMSVSGSTITKPFILYTSQLFGVELQFCSGIISLPTSMVVYHIIWLRCRADSGLVSSVQKLHPPPMWIHVNTHAAFWWSSSKTLQTIQSSGLTRSYQWLLCMCIQQHLS